MTMPLLGNPSPKFSDHCCTLMAGTVTNGLLAFCSVWLSFQEEESFRNGAWIFSILSVCATGGFFAKRLKYSQIPHSETVFCLLNTALAVTTIVFSTLGATKGR